MTNQFTHEDLDAFEAEAEEAEIRAGLEAEYFAVDQHGVRRMNDPAYAKLFDTRLQMALDLQRSANGLPTAGAKSEPPQEPRESERAEWERLYFALDPKTKERLIQDPAYRAKCDAMRDRIFGISRRDANGRIVG